MIVAQLTSSSLRNQTTTRDGRTLLEKVEAITGASTVFHEKGYLIDRSELPDAALGFGWNKSAGAQHQVVQVRRISALSDQPSIGVSARRLSGDPIVFKSGGGPPVADWLVKYRRRAGRGYSDA